MQLIDGWAVLMAYEGVEKLVGRLDSLKVVNKELH